MKAVLTRVKSASVTIDNEVYSSIQKGFLVLLGVGINDTEKEADKIANKICGLRIFEDEDGKMNIGPSEAGAEFLIVSQFTLYADCSSRRPGFSKAAKGDIANPLYEHVVSECEKRGFVVKTGKFGADMKVESINDGPITIILDTNEL